MADAEREVEFAVTVAAHVEPCGAPFVAAVWMCLRMSRGGPGGAGASTMPHAICGCILYTH